MPAMRRVLLGALALVAASVYVGTLAPPGSSLAQTNPCPVVGSTPQFTAGGNVFGRIAAQWNAYFGGKVDINNGILCNPTIYPPVVSTLADPTAVIGIAAVPGTAISGMRSDAAPRALPASQTDYGLMKVDGTTQSAAAGVVSTNPTTINGVACTPGGSCTVPGSATFADPTATIGVAAVNGTAITAMRSDAAPAIPKSTATTYGAVEPDNTTITATNGVITAAATTINSQTCTPGGSCTVPVPSGANPTATAGNTAVNGVATTFMRSDAAPAVATATTSTAGIAKLHNVPVAVGWIAGNNPNGAIIANINQASTISAIVGSVETAVGSAATVQVNKAPSGTACSAGTNLATGTFNANGTAATNQTLTLVGGATDTLAVGDRLCLQSTGTGWTTGAGIGGITVFLAPS